MIFVECHLDASIQCLVTKDRNYLGPNTVDQFDALLIQVRFFLKNKETMEMIPKKRKGPFINYVNTKFLDPASIIMDRINFGKIH